MTKRQGVEIDYCPECNGIWLDNGELNRLISLSKKNKSDHSSNTSDNFTKQHLSEPKKMKAAKSVLSSFFDLLDSDFDDD